MPDLAAGESLLRGEENQSLVCAVAQSSNSGVGDAAVAVQEKFDSGSKGIALSNSEHSTGKDDAQAPGWTNRFCLPDLTASKSLLDGEASQTLVCTAAESSIGDVGDAAVTVQVDVNSTCNGTALSLPNSEHSTGKDDPHLAGPREYVSGMHLLNVHRVLAESVPWKKH